MQQIYTALTRPKLRNGCDATLNALNVMFSLAFGLTLLHHLSSMWMPILVYYLMRTLLRWCAKEEPQWLGIYSDHLKLRHVFLAHSDSVKREKRPKRVLFRFPKWSV
jgi:type IV secretory pathway TrbD component